MKINLLLAGVFIFALPLGLESRASESSVPNDVPIVIAHRGASGLLPEHTLAAYELALMQGADFIEPDLVPTRDGALIARHENALAMVSLDDTGHIQRDDDGVPLIREATTDVMEHPRFRNRLTVKLVDGRPVGGWFSEDFTLAEIRTLRARERMPQVRPANRRFDDRFEIPELREIIELLERFEASSGRQAGLYPELKHPTYFQSEGRRLDGALIGVDTGGLLLEALIDTGFTDPERVFIQSFEMTALHAFEKKMRKAGLVLPLIQLFGDTGERYPARAYDLTYHALNGLGSSFHRDLARLIPGGITVETGYAQLASPAVLAFMAEHYAAGLGIPRHLAMPTRRLAEGGEPGRWVVTGEKGELLRRAHAQSLAVHVYTLRAETPFLLQQDGQILSVVDEARALMRMGVDGFFIDQPAAGRQAVDLQWESTGPSGTR